MLAGVVPVPFNKSIVVATMLTIHRFFFGSFIGLRIRYVGYRIVFS